MSPSRVVATGVLGLILLVVGPSTPAWAHHIMGIPHYSYDENYPQAPVLKLIENVGQWEFQLTGYPGKPVPGVPTELHVYVVDAESRRLYQEPVSIEIHRLSLLGTRSKVYGPRETTLSENVYKFYPTYEVEGNYEITLAFPDGDVTSTLTFPMVAGEPGSPTLILGGGAFAFVLFLLVIRSLKIKRARRLERDAA